MSREWLMAVLAAATLANAAAARADFSFSNGTIGRIQDPVQSHVVCPQTRLLDFGRDAFGWLEVRGEGIGNVSLGERLSSDGRVDVFPVGSVRGVCRTNISFTADWTRVPLTADVRNTCGVNGKAVAIQLPEDVGIVMPFRYAEVPAGTEARRVVVVYPMEQRVKWSAKGKGLRDDVAARLDRLFDFCSYSIRATSFAGLYVDGDRERIPYEGDLYGNMLGQLYGVDGDPTLARKTIRHLLKHPTWPAEWQQHLVMSVWEDWHYTGETNLVAETYDALREKTLIGAVRPGDVLIESVPGVIVDWPACERDGYDMTARYNAVVNAFHYRTLLEMRDLSAAIGRMDEAAFYGRRAVAVKADFNRKLYDPRCGLYRDGLGSNHHSLHANVAALDFGLVEKEQTRCVADFIASKGMACSPYFAQYLLEALFRFGKRKEALELLSSDGPRSWLGMMKQGATMTMEAWSSEIKPNQDWNHAWGAAPANLLPRFMP